MHYQTIITLVGVVCCISTVEMKMFDEVLISDALIVIVIAYFNSFATLSCARDTTVKFV